MRARRFRVTLLAIGYVALCGAGIVAVSSRASGEGKGEDAGPITYKGLSITAKSLERAKRVSLQDCPPGANTVHGVIRPVENNEFVTVGIEVKVLPEFQPTALPKPVLYDEAGEAYKTAQSFGEMNAKPSYSCSFSFRLPKGTKVSRFTIGEASFDLSSLEH